MCALLFIKRVLPLQPSVDELNAVIINYFPPAQKRRGPVKAPLFLSPQLGLLHGKGLEKNTHTLFLEEPGDGWDQDVLGTAN